MVTPRVDPARATTAGWKSGRRWRGNAGLLDMVGPDPCPEEAGREGGSSVVGGLVGRLPERVVPGFTVLLGWPPSSGSSASPGHCWLQQRGALNDISVPPVTRCTR